MGDVHNLTWKLAAVLNGVADPTLLESYGTERRPVAQRVVAQALSSFFQHAEIDQAVGLDPEDRRDLGWAALEELFSDTRAGRDETDPGRCGRRPQGARIRRPQHRDRLPVREGAIVAESALEGDEESIRSGSFPRHGQARGCPHAWVGSGIHRRSTYELVRPGRFTLFIGDDGAAWRDAADRVRATRPIPLDVIAIGERSGLPDGTGAWRQQSEAGPADAVLVRPIITWPGARRARFSIPPQCCGRSSRRSCPRWTARRGASSGRPSPRRHLEAGPAPGRSLRAGLLDQVGNVPAAVRQVEAHRMSCPAWSARPQRREDGFVLGLDLFAVSRVVPIDVHADVTGCGLNEPVDEHA